MEIATKIFTVMITVGLLLLIIKRKVPQTMNVLEVELFNLSTVLRPIVLIGLGLIGLLLTQCIT